MKRSINFELTIVFLAVVLAVAGCSRYPERVDAADTSAPRGGITEQLEGGVWVYQDPDTGCEYLVTHKGGITPRMEDKAGRSGISNPQKGCSYN